MLNYIQTLIKKQTNQTFNKKTTNTTLINNVANEINSATSSELKISETIHNNLSELKNIDVEINTNIKYYMKTLNLGHKIILL